ncbi:helix-hairpin-helix domain-containing protein [Clostridium sp. NSJ-145]|uniref:helix-hairpin-helix domain-containing protein n=1 Tax=Clostridium sp. NSJ-145 TaxID=2897777 RepID=UPI001E28EACA|nr:helix-hairpin-helix domain-containing protein [Clostridium sp. NSJ-145]MCD2501572.1 helix-hairpin-helix domain-containing protein [Clostridium sp. NSJ-145]
MDKFKDKKVIATIIVLTILFISSIILYGKNNNKVFSDKYMQNIFVDSDEQISDNLISNMETLVTNEEKLDVPMIFVEIKGEVLIPDVYELQEGSIVKDLIEKAGGLTGEANITNINRAKKLQNHELVIISNINDENTNTVFNEVVIESDGLININLADINELKKITGIGDVKAQSIIEYREKNGGFKSVDEIKNVDGIGEKTFEKIKEKITL